jgi:hypothetical protein
VWRALWCFWVLHTHDFLLAALALIDVVKTNIKANIKQMSGFMGNVLVVLIILLLYQF